MMRPPRLATRWLERRLHPDERDEVIGDLHEEFDLRRAHSRFWASLWYWRETLALLSGFAVQRRDLLSTAHERTRGRWMATNAALDLRDAWRSLNGSRSFACVAVLTLTSSIGLSTAVFSVVDGVLLKPLPYAGADRLVRLSETSLTNVPIGLRAFVQSGTGRPRSEVSDVTVGLLLDESRTLEAITPISTGGKSVSVVEGTVRVETAEVGGSFFSLLGTTATAGRLLQPADSHRGVARVAVVSDGFWARALDHRPDVIGSLLTIDGAPYTVVGVAPPGIAFPAPDIDIWIAGQWLWPSADARRMFETDIEVIARLRAGVTVGQATIEAARIEHEVATAQRSGLPLGAPAVLTVTPLRNDIVAPIRGALVMLMVGMGLVLVAACVNLANLLLARGTGRQREIAIRLALGASRWRIIRPLLVEQLILGAIGGLLGGALGWWILRALPLVAPADMPRLTDVRFNAASLVYVTAVAVVTAAIVGLWPAWRLKHQNLRDRSAGAGRVGLGRTATSAHALRRMLVVTQVALASALLVGAVLIGRSLLEALRVHPGYQPTGAMTFQVAVPAVWSREKGRTTEFFESVMARIAEHEGVIAVGRSSTLPLHQTGEVGSFSIVGEAKATSPDAMPIAIDKMISPDYLRAIGTGLVRGRYFTAADSDTAERVALVDEALVALYFPTSDPLGQQIAWWGNHHWKIVGVVEASHQGPMTSPTQPTFYLPIAQLPESLGFDAAIGGAAVRTAGDPIAMLPFIRSVVKALDPNAPVHNAMRLDDRFNATFAQPRFFALALALFSVLALTTAVFGVYGVLSYTVERRRVEFGIRRALGARERDIVSLVVRQGFTLAGLGLGIGLVTTASGAGLLRSLLFGVQPLDPATFAVTSAVIACVALGASWQPARRALRVEPAEALRVN